MAARVNVQPKSIVGYIVLQNQITVAVDLKLGSNYFFFTLPGSTGTYVLWLFDISTWRNQRALSLFYSWKCIKYSDQWNTTQCQ